MILLPHTGHNSGLRPILRHIESEDDCHHLQQDIDRVVQWSQNNKLQLNVNKCSVLTFSRAREPLHYSYKVDNAPLKREEVVRDLGVRMDTQLRFREHITSVCKKAYKRLGFVLRTAASFTNMKAISVLYDALIRSQLECNAAIWAPHEAKYNLMLERIQNKYTRYMYLRLYGVYPFYPLMYPALFVLGMVGYNKLETRRDLALASYTLRVFRGILHNPGILQWMGLRVPDKYVQRRRQPTLFMVPRSRTKLLESFPLTRALRTLNLVAERIDVLTCSQSEFTRVTLFVLCYL